MKGIGRCFASVLLPLVLGGCVPPSKECGDFALATLAKMRRGNATLRSPDFSVGKVSEKHVFKASGLPFPIDPLDFDLASSAKQMPAGTVSGRESVVLVRVLGASGKRELGSAAFDSRMNPTRPAKRSGGGEKATAFLVEVRTKRHAELDGEASIEYFVRGVPDEFWER